MNLVTVTLPFTVSPEKAALILEAWHQKSAKRRTYMMEYRGGPKLRGPYHSLRERIGEEAFLERVREQRRIGSAAWKKRADPRKRAELNKKKRTLKGKRYSAWKIARLASQHGKCGGCGVAISLKQAQIDHILPRAKGGSNAKSNLWLLCGPCNRSKSDTFHFL